MIYPTLRRDDLFKLKMMDFRYRLRSTYLPKVGLSMPYSMSTNILWEATIFVMPYVALEIYEGTNTGRFGHLTLV